MTKMASFCNALNIKKLTFELYSVSDVAIMQKFLPRQIISLRIDLCQVNSVTAYDHLNQDFNIMEFDSIAIIQRLYIKIGQHITLDDLHIVFIMFKIQKNCIVVLHFDRDSSPLSVNLATFFDFGRDFMLEIKADIITTDLILAFQIIQY